MTSEATPPRAPRSDSFYFLDPRLTLVPSEALSAEGIEESFAQELRAMRGWDDARIELLEEGLRLYWTRASSLSRRVRTVGAPRLRSIAVIRDADAVRPFAQILNTSAWTLYEDDIASPAANPELVAFLLLYGDRVNDTGEVTRAAVDLAPYFFELDEASRELLTAAAQRSARPDAGIYRAIAEALPWLRQLRHEHIRPPRSPAGHRAIPGTGLLVPRAIETEPDLLIDRCREAARAAVERFRTAARATSGKEAALELCEWLAREAPPLLVVEHKGRILWDPDMPRRVDDLRRRTCDAGATAVRDVHADLVVVAERTQRFLASVVEPATLPRPHGDVAQRGYTYMHRERRLIAYDLDEPGIERLHGPAIPYAREMVGARTLHEWGHLATDAGFVPRNVDDATWGARRGALAEQLGEVVRRAPRPLRDLARRDLGAHPGPRLCEIFCTRLPDYQANLLAFRWMSSAERETYVRHNVRPLGREYTPHQTWRLLVRYLYEFQYLGWSAIPDAQRYLRQNTGFDTELIASRMIGERAWRDIAEAAAAICASFAPDPRRVRGLPEFARGDLRPRSGIACLAP